MASIHLLSAVSRPPKRLLVSQNALPFSLGSGALLYQVTMSPLFFLGWFFIHGFFIYKSYKDPYFVDVWKASFRVGRTKRRHDSGGNFYDL